MKTTPPTSPSSTVDSSLARQRQRSRLVARRWRIDVLLVEDDPADRSLALEILWRDPRVRDVRTSDAPDAMLFTLAEGPWRPDLILLDINMPRVNGFKFLEAVREIPSMRQTPVVFLTTSRMARDVEAARVSTASFYLVKPDTYTEFVARLSAVIEQTVTDAWSQ